MKKTLITKKDKSELLNSTVVSDDDCDDCRYKSIIVDKVVCENTLLNELNQTLKNENRFLNKILDDNNNTYAEVV